MKYLKKLFSTLCVVTVLSFSNPFVYSSFAESDRSYEVADNNLYQEVKTGLEELIADLEGSLKKNIPDVEEVFEGSAIEREIGVGIKIYKNTAKNGYYYFLMASIDVRTDGSSNDRLLFTNDLSFSFNKEGFLSNLKDYYSLSGPEASGRARGTTFILDDSDKQFYLGVKYLDILKEKEKVLAYTVKISPHDEEYIFEGEASNNDYTPAK